MDLSAPAPAVPASPMQKLSNQYIVTLKASADIDAAAFDMPNILHAGQVTHVYKNAMHGFAISLPDNLVDLLKKDPRIESVTPDYQVSIQRTVAMPAMPAMPVQNNAWWDAFFKRPSSSSSSRPASSSSSSVSSAPASSSSSASSQPASSSSVASSAPASTQTVPAGIARIHAAAKDNKGTDVEVAVIDTGIDTSHPDLQGAVLGGVDCVDSTGSYQDANGHGTHVSGTIAARDNGFGVVGVAPEAKLWAVRVLDSQGSGTWSSIICGVDFVTKNASHIKVASMSLGGAGTAGSSCDSSTLRKAICNAVNAGVTFVVAAGNDGKDLQNSVPAAYPEVIAVSALDDTNGSACGGGSSNNYGADDAFASFSNYASASADKARLIAAPGVSIQSTLKGGGYGLMSGTSMATPHVSGAAALYIKAHPGASPQDVKNGLLNAAEPANVNFNTECVSGKVSHASTSSHPEAVLRADAF